MHTGFVLLNCDLGSEDYILEELNNMNGVNHAYITFGAYDVIAEVHAESQKDFDELVSMKIRRLARVVSTMTLNVVKT
tara:strand:- start:2799 stop:3032 length:234 start_codon:yes stop_codon:yes gene_type:complete